MPEIYTHPETGAEVEIPAGADVHRENGEIHYWRMPPAHKGEELHPDQVEDYNPKFERSGLTRRVLQNITDEVDQDWLGPRNSITAIAYALLRDDETRQIKPEDGAIEAESKVQGELDKLIEAGLVELRDDSTVAVTDAGHTELVN